MEGLACPCIFFIVNTWKVPCEPPVRWCIKPAAWINGLMNISHLWAPGDMNAEIPAEERATVR